jgi:hypothetical protein
MLPTFSAPGGGLLSSIPGNNFALYQGTSMVRAQPGSLLPAVVAAAVTAAAAVATAALSTARQPAAADCSCSIWVMSRHFVCHAQCALYQGTSMVWARPRSLLPADCSCSIWLRAATFSVMHNSHCTRAHHGEGSSQAACCQLWLQLLQLLLRRRRRWPRQLLLLLSAALFGS